MNGHSSKGAGRARGWRPGWSARLFEPVDPASLAFFRVGFGAILFWEVVRYFASGWIAGHYLEPSFHFTYYGFSWVRPWPGPGMYVHFAVLGVAALGMMLGWRHHLCSLVYFLGFGYLFLLEKARYLNHFYLVALLCGLMAVLPAGRAFALDARRRGGDERVPRWPIELLRAQIGLVYFFAGVAKLNPDWLRARPLIDWLGRRGGHPLLGDFFTQEWVAWLFSYGGLFLDLLAWPLLCMRATRLPAYLLLGAFHLTNATLFNIGIFPWTMLVVTTIFFEPGWPRRFLARLPRVERAPPRPNTAQRRTVIAFCALWLAVQVLVPLRHFLYPGNVSWTEEGHAFAWHMKLRGKDGRAFFRVRDADTGESWMVDPEEELRPWQARKMCGRPDMVLEYAHHLAERWRADGHARVEVRATCLVSLNGRRHVLLIDPERDLAAVRPSWRPYDWILPLEEPLRPQRRVLPGAGELEIEAE